MTDKTELKRLADAANAVMGDVRVDVAITSESGPNQDEIDSVTAFLKLATPAAVLALIAENEALTARINEMHADRVEAVVEIVVQGLEIDQLTTENEALRRAMHELANHPKLTASQADILRAAMGKGEQL